MRRILPWISALIAVGVILAAGYEISTRDEDGQAIATPTAVPSPSPTPVVTTPSPGATGSPEPFETPGPFETTTPVPTQSPTDGEVVATGPQAGEDEMPVTGGGALSGGFLVIGLAGGLRALSRRR